MTTHYLTPEQSALIKKAPYINHYDPSQLFPIPRQLNRDQLDIGKALPFHGFDIWTHYEVSWLNNKGKPVVALAQIIINCDSENIVESKSMKLYFNSLNNTRFADTETVRQTVEKDLAAQLKGSFVKVKIIPVTEFKSASLQRGMGGICLDELDVECSVYHHHPDYLTTENEIVEEALYSDLLKSNCLVTNQPDWCSVQISYRGKKINHAGLLQYIVSFRDDNEFHEQGAEKIFMQIKQRCQPEILTVFSRSTRRGGIDISSYRSTQPVRYEDIVMDRLCRQ